ncbi:MAG: site-specific integrase, partial [Clostridia bacterium]|nr:site-specific integrase [Clostridia bacterium]
MKYKDWFNTWLELYVKPVVKIQSYEKYARNVRVHIAPSLGDYELEQLRAEVLQRFVVNKAEILSPNTVNGLVTVLQKSLNMAVVLGICATQFADKIVRPKSQERKVECFTIAVQKKIEKAVLEGKKDKMLGVVLCLYTGLRVGELLVLQWNDIDFKKGIIYINKSCHWGKINGGYGIILDTPKTLQSIREIPIPKQLLQHLKALKKNNSSEFVVSWHDKPVPTRSYQKSFELLLKRINIPH